MNTSTVSRIIAEASPRTLLSLVALPFSVISYVIERCTSRAARKLQREKELLQELRERELQFLDRQLRDLWGPLYATCSQSRVIYQAFKESAHVLLGRADDVPRWTAKKLLQEGFATSGLIQLHRTWICTIMLPQWTHMEHCIRNGGDLLVGSQYPTEFGDVLTHIFSWRLLVATWEGTDTGDKGERTYERNFAPIRYPTRYQQYLERTFGALQDRKRALLAQLRPDMPMEEENNEGRSTRSSFFSPTLKNKTM